TGTDRIQLVHRCGDERVSLASWSGDSQRLATFTPNDEIVHVWDVLTGAEVHRFAADAAWIGLDPRGTHLYVLQRKSSPQYTTVLTLVDVGASRVVDATALPSLQLARISPDERYVAVAGGQRTALLDGDDLSVLHEAPFKGFPVAIAFRADSNEWAVSWAIINEIFGGSSGVKAWDCDSGVVTLDAPAHPGWNDGWTLAYRSDGALLAGNSVFEPLGR
ncbi:MAG: hypothetical protein KDA61_16280, partial [Planctomycetales bacterium]|nr:hypothetical protein [Planctomycetales bacterium]